MIHHKLRPLQHLLRFRGDVNHVHLLFPGFLFCAVPHLQRRHNTVLEGVKTLAAKVLVILDYVASARPSIIRHLRVVHGFQSQLRLDDCPNQGSVMNIQQFTDSGYAILWTFEALNQIFGQLDVVEAQVLECPQSKNVACFAAQDVWHVAFLEQFDGVGYADVVAFDAEDSGGKLLHIRFDCG